MFAAPQLADRHAPLLQLKPVQHVPLVQLSLRPSHPLGAGSQRPAVPQRMPRQHELLALHVSFSAPHMAGVRHTAFTHTNDEQHALVAHEALSG